LRPVGRNRRSVFITDGMKHFLRHYFFTAIFHVKFKHPGFDYGVDRTGFLTKTTINTLEQINVVARGSPGTIRSEFRLDRDRSRRANGFTQFAGNTAFFAVRIPAQRMQPSKPR
jgi:hypothetical protein